MWILQEYLILDFEGHSINYKYLTNKVETIGTGRVR